MPELPLFSSIVNNDQDYIVNIPQHSKQFTLRPYAKTFVPSTYGLLHTGFSVLNPNAKSFNSISDLNTERHKIGTKLFQSTDVCFVSNTIQDKPLRSDLHVNNTLTLSPEIDDLYTPSMAELSVINIFIPQRNLNGNINGIRQGQSCINPMILNPKANIFIPGM